MFKRFYFLFQSLFFNCINIEAIVNILTIQSPGLNQVSCYCKNTSHIQKKTILFIVGESVNWCGRYRNHYGDYSKDKKQIYCMNKPAIPPLATYPKLSIFIQRYVFICPYSYTIHNTKEMETT